MEASHEAATWPSGGRSHKDAHKTMKALSSTTSPTQYLTGPWLNKHKESLFLSFDQCPLTFPGLDCGATRMNPDQPCLGQCVLPEKPNNVSGWGSEVT